MTTLQASNNTHNCRGELCLNTATTWGRKDILFKQWLTVKIVGTNLKFFVSDNFSNIGDNRNFFFCPNAIKNILLSVHSPCLMLRIGLTQCLRNQNIYGSESKWLNLSATSSCVHWTTGSYITYIINWTLIILITTCHKRVGQAKHILI